MKLFYGWVAWVSQGFLYGVEGLRILADDPADNGLHYSQVMDAEMDQGDGSSSQDEVALGEPSSGEYEAMLLKIVTAMTRDDDVANEIRTFLKRPGVDVNRVVERTYGYSAGESMTFTRAAATCPVPKIEVLKVLVIEFDANFDAEIEGRGPLFFEFIKSSIPSFQSALHLQQPSLARYIETDATRTSRDEHLAHTLSCLLRHGVVPKFPIDGRFERPSPLMLLAHVTDAFFYKTLKVLVDCPQITAGHLHPHAIIWNQSVLYAHGCCEILDKLAFASPLSIDLVAAWAALLSKGSRYNTARLLLLIRRDIGEDCEQFRAQVRRVIAQHYDPFSTPYIDINEERANKNKINKLKMLTMLILGSDYRAHKANDVRAILAQTAFPEDTESLMYAFTACVTDADRRRRAYMRKVTRLHLADTFLCRSKYLPNHGAANGQFSQVHAASAPTPQTASRATSSDQATMQSSMITRAQAKQIRSSRAQRVGEASNVDVPASSDAGSSERTGAMWAVFCDENLMDIIFEQGREDRERILMGLSPGVVCPGQRGTVTPEQ